MIDKFCQHCGYKQISSNKFCGNCGKVPFSKIKDDFTVINENVNSGFKYLFNSTKVIAISFFILSLVFLVELLVSSKILQVGKDYKVIVNAILFLVFMACGVLLFLRNRYK